MAATAPEVKHDIKPDLHLYNLARKQEGEDTVSQKWFDDNYDSDEVKSTLEKVKQSQDEADFAYVCPYTRSAFSTKENYEKYVKSEDFQKVLK